MTIMIVDDSGLMREMIRTILGNSADRFIECSNGEEAIHEYGKHRPEYVIMDVVMPRMDGINATRSIMQSHPEARIIIVTHHADSDLRDEAGEAGALGYVLKENLSQLRHLIAGRRT